MSPETRSEPKTGIVIPTLGKRQDLLYETVSSVRQSGNCHLIVVKPRGVIIEDRTQNLVDQIIDENRKGLACAINQGIRALPRKTIFASWIGDDDLLEPNSLQVVENMLDEDKLTGLVYGKCRYIKSNGEALGVNRSGRFAAWLMRVGPCLVPQPGSLFRRDLFEKLGGLDEDLRFAFDLDLFLRIQALSRIKYIDEVVSSFRWHGDSLTVGSRKRSVEESRMVRTRYLSSFTRCLSPIWEIPGTWASLMAGELLTQISNR